MRSCHEEFVTIMKKMLFPKLLVRDMYIDLCVTLRVFWAMGQRKCGKSVEFHHSEHLRTIFNAAFQIEAYFQLYSVQAILQLKNLVNYNVHIS